MTMLTTLSHRTEKETYFYPKGSPQQIASILDCVEVLHHIPPSLSRLVTPELLTPIQNLDLESLKSNHLKQMFFLCMKSCVCVFEPLGCWTVSMTWTKWSARDIREPTACLVTCCWRLYTWSSRTLWVKTDTMHMEMRAQQLWRRVRLNRSLRTCFSVHNLIENT